MAFQKAKREQIYPKVALIGPSGSGKSYSALRMATGYVKKMGKGSEIYYIDSEGGRGKYYADEFEYNYMEIQEPYTPEKYINAINDAVDSGNCGVLIIDSITHEWSGKGGILEQHNNMPGNSYTNWAKLTPKHNSFVDKILLSPTCVISTVRGKDDYVVEEKNGKQVPKKVGVGAETRQNFEYEMTVAFNIDQSNHVASATKDNTKLFDNVYNVLTEKEGALIYEWANSGDAVEAPVKKSSAPVIDETNLSETDIAKNKIKEKVAEAKTVTTSEKISDTVKKICTTANYNKVDDISVLNKVIEALDNLIKEGK